MNNIPAFSVLGVHSCPAEDDIETICGWFCTVLHMSCAIIFSALPTVPILKVSPFNTLQVTCIILVFASKLGPEISFHFKIYYKFNFINIKKDKGFLVTETL